MIYPLVKHRAKKSDYVNKIISDLSEKADVKIEKVDYEFRKGANEMMRIKKGRININNYLKKYVGR